MSAEVDPLRQIADSLANLEKLYAEETRRQEEQRQTWDEQNKSYEERQQKYDEWWNKNPCPCQA